MTAAARMIDANANRAREALRVMEDVARFALDDSGLTADLKSLRHDLRAALERLPPGWLEAGRDTPGDVGTAITAEREHARAGVADVAIAAGKRLSEALRVIEEVGKITLDPSLARAVEALRYRSYELDRRLNQAVRSGQAQQWRVCVLLTESLCRHPWRDVVEAALAGGADCIQLREKDLPGRALIERAAWIIERARPAGSAVIVNDRLDVALASGADGVHVGQEDLSVAQVRAVCGRALLVGVSTHDRKEAEAAVRAGADYCGVGAMFASPLKPQRPPSGPDYLRWFIATYPAVPHLAIGGITPENLEPLLSAGVRGVAVSTAVCAAEDPGRVVAELTSAIERGGVERISEALRGS